MIYIGSIYNMNQPSYNIFTVTLFKNTIPDIKVNFFLHIIVLKSIRIPTHLTQFIFYFESLFFTIIFLYKLEKHYNLI